jgi:hypothetical protein
LLRKIQKQKYLRYIRLICSLKLLDLFEPSIKNEELIGNSKFLYASCRLDL